jgi:hypothetical protein
MEIEHKKGEMKMKSIQIMHRTVFAEEEIGKKIEEELEKTVSMMKELGYEVRYEIGTKINILFEYEGEECFIIAILFNPETNMILDVALGVDEVASPTIVMKSYREKFGTIWGCNSRELKGDFITPITYLQTQKTRLLLNK